MATVSPRRNERDTVLVILRHYGLDPDFILEDGVTAEGYWEVPRNDDGTVMRDGDDFLRVWREWPNDHVFDELSHHLVSFN